MGAGAVVELVVMVLKFGMTMFGIKKENQKKFLSYIKSNKTHESADVFNEVENQISELDAKEKKDA